MSRYIDADHLRKWILSWWERTEPTSECLKGRDILNQIDREPSIDIVRCKECVYYDPPHVEDKGKRIEYKDLPKEAFDELGIGLVNMSYGVNIGGRCCVDYNCGYGEDKRVYREEGNFCSKGRRPLNSSEKPNNSTISKMEQVETMSCAECKHRPIGAEICEEPRHYEPQTDWHYDEQDATWYPYKHEDEPKTEDEILREQCRAFMGIVEQTERSDNADR